MLFLCAIPAIAPDCRPRLAGIWIDAAIFKLLAMTAILQYAQSYLSLNSIFLELPS